MVDDYKREDVQQIAIVLTDGASNVDANRTHLEAQQATKENVDMFAIGKFSGFFFKQNQISITQRSFRCSIVHYNKR